MSQKTDTEETYTEETYTSVGSRGTEFRITIRRPVLTPEEYDRRMNELKCATAEFWRAKYEAEAREAV